jgi:transcriptional regulator with XRE-family HTH domain
MNRKIQNVASFERDSIVRISSIQPPTFGEDLRNLRRQHFHYQAALANACGCSVAHISSLESGKRFPSRQMLAKLERAFESEQAPQGEIAELLERARDLIVGRYFGGSSPQPPITENRQ